MQAAEIELKFAVDDITALRARVTDLGFMLLTERTFEANTLYDNADHMLLGKRQVLPPAHLRHALHAHAQAPA